MNGLLEGSVINHGVKLTASLMLRDWGECNPKVVHRVRFIPDRSVLKRQFVKPASLLQKHSVE